MSRQQSYSVLDIQSGFKVPQSLSAGQTAADRCVM